MRTTEPNTIRQGERIEWTRAISNYSAEDYDLEYRFRSNVGPGADVVATADETGFIAVLTAAQSALMSPGSYEWQAWLTEQADATNTFQVDAGRSNVELGFVSGSTGNVETRSVARQHVDALQAALLAPATGQPLEYEITTPAGSRRVKYEAGYTREEQLNWLKYWKKIVAREIAIARYQAGKGYGRGIQFNVRES